MRAPIYRLIFAVTMCLIPALLSKVEAQAPPSYTVDDVAQFIITQFPYGSTNLKLPNEWCYFVETESAYNWWYFKDPSTKEFTALRVRHAARISARYTDPQDNQIPTKYASIFLGLKFVDDRDVLTFNALNFKGGSTRTPKNGCDLGEFLLTYGIPYLMEVVADPKSAVIDPAKYVDNDYRYWNFGGRTHKITNILNISIKLRWDSGATIDANLIVGYGGGAGP
ncbi:MAG TPA: hypothetical protein VMS64_27495 [Candidatus Methylomirabilis sp.]|nr:hypothetical protein [Candidatus Methylomirabilis sp.]